MISNDAILKACKTYKTPFHIYDEKSIRENAKSLNQAFSWNPGFKEYFAVKATPNPFLLKILKSEGLGADCSSLAELILSEYSGMKGEEIMFTSNNTPIEEYRKAKELGAIINLDDITHLSFLEDGLGLPELLSFRFNPGPERQGNVIIGNPADAKFGLTREQLYEAYKVSKERGVKRFGLHTMVVSNELDMNNLELTAKMLFEIAEVLAKEFQIKLDFINLGGGIGIPYNPGETAVDYNEFSQRVKKLYNTTFNSPDIGTPAIMLECGRCITGPYGYLVSKAIHSKSTYKEYIGVDASMANLMRPGMYGSYHEITVLGKENAPKDHQYDVVGSLCENNDKLATNRDLPQIEAGDILLIHNSGAHGHSMGFNYNGKTRSAELLLRESGEIIEIRRAETLEDHFATLDLSQVENFQ